MFQEHDHQSRWRLSKVDDRGYRVFYKAVEHQVTVIHRPALLI